MSAPGNDTGGGPHRKGNQRRPEVGSEGYPNDFQSMIPSGHFLRSSLYRGRYITYK